ncbi:MAG TPA: BatA domain-containing protein [Candidatus Brocadiia bacterium]|nr:BatA domain-containing protein [Candidatus Brocadiia bacterium]
MELSFLHWGMLAAAAVGAAPILIHLLARGRPVTVPFPPLILLRKTFHKTARRSRIRHLLLLILRIALIAAFAVALARPMVKGAAFAVAGKGIICAALVIDDSMSMQYIENGRQRFDSARDSALAFLDSAGQGSMIAVYPASAPRGQLTPDLDAAKAQLRSMKPTARGDSLWPAIRAAADLLIKTGEGDRSIVVFTDMTSAAWRGAEGIKLDPAVRLQVVPSGNGENDNLSIGKIELASSLMVRNAASHLAAAARCGKAGSSVSVGLFIDGVKRDQALIRLEPGEAEMARFKIPLDAVGMRTGKLALSEADPLPIDNERYFCFTVAENVKVLVVGAEGEDSDALYAATALSPFGEKQPSAFSVTRCLPAALDAQDLGGMDVAILANVPELNDDAWRKLLRFVDRKGGLIIILGEDVKPENYAGRIPSQLLPAAIGRIIEFKDAVHLQVDIADHPLAVPFADGRNGNLYGPSFFAAVAGDPSPDAKTIFSFDGKQPAILERLRDGRVVMFMTGLGRQWTDMPRSDPYPCFLPFMHELVKYVCGRGPAAIADFPVGGTVSMPLPAQASLGDLRVFPPGEPDGKEVVAGSKTDRFIFNGTDRPGIYLVKGRDGRNYEECAFAVNTAEAESDLGVIEKDAVEAMFQGGKVSFSKDAQELRNELTEQRLGREATWIVLAVVVLLFVGEHYLANRFYGNENRAELEQDDVGTAVKK